MGGNQNLDLIILIIGSSGAVISFVTLLLVSAVAFIIKGIHASVKSSHERLDQYIEVNNNEHTGIRREFVSHITCDELRKRSMCSILKD